MSNKIKIYQAKSKKLPPMVYDYHQLTLLSDFRESLNEIFEPHDGLYSEEEAAKYLSVPVQTLKNYSKKKKLTWREIGKKKKYTQEDLDDFIERKVKLHKDF